MSDNSNLERRKSVSEIAHELKYLSNTLEFKLEELNKKIDRIIKDTEDSDERIRRLEDKSSTIKGYFLGLGALGALLSDKIAKYIS